MAAQRAPSHPSDDRYTVKVGELVGNYRLEELIGEGGMGVVFRAVHKDIGRKAAVKILYRAFARDPEFSARFLNEARAVNLVGHPGLVEIFEFGRLPDETPYIIMEFLEGQSLSSRIATRGRQRLALKEQSLVFCRQVAVALAAAHDKGVVHRDLKPENIMLVRDPLTQGAERIKILDFGIAKLSQPGGKSGAAITRTGATMGSPLYMAPEQCQELSTVTDRADVYALGVILYELLAGRTPFVSDLPAELMVMHVRRAPPPLREIDETIDEPVAALVHTMLAKDPSARPRMSKVADALGRLNLSFGGASPVTRVLQQRRRTLQVAIGASCAIIAVVGALLALRSPKPPSARLKIVPPTQPELRPVPAPPVPAPPATVEWVITTTPPGAEVLDEATATALGRTPLTLKRPRRPGRQAVVLHLTGHRDVTVQLDGEHDLSIDRQLSTVSTSSGSQSGSKPPPRRPYNKDDLITPPF